MKFFTLARFQPGPIAQSYDNYWSRFIKAAPQIKFNK